jgi:2-keto-4-pentenoate hydratase
MEASAIRHAARLLAAARRSGELLSRLPEACRPRNGDEAYAIQLALVDELGESIAGWKVALSPEHGTLVGVIVGSRLYAPGATIDVTGYAMRGAEAEIAFRFDRALPPRQRDYTRDEVADAATALVGLEIADTRFASYEGTPLIERAADFLSNGALVVGEPRPDWRPLDLGQLEAYVAIDGREVVRRRGGHPNRDPLIPTVALVNQLRLGAGAPAGSIVTTGSYVGMPLAPPDCVVEAGFASFGSARCRLSSRP